MEKVAQKFHLTYGVLRSRRHSFRYQICGDLGEPRAEERTLKPLLGEVCEAKAQRPEGVFFR